MDAFLLSDVHSDDQRVALLAEAGIPFACFGRTSPGYRSTGSTSTTARRTAMAVEHLLGRGLTQLAFVGYRVGEPLG